MCPGTAGEQWLVVALGGSDVSGWGVSNSEAYSPQLSFAAQYAELLCQQEGVKIELHIYYPLGSELAPLAWWIDKASTDEALRGDLATADVVVMTAMSAHDIVIAQFLPGACSGAWPDPLKSCLEQKTAHIPDQTDELFGLIADLVGGDAIVLAGDTFAPPAAVAGPDWDEPYQAEVKLMVDPYYVVKEVAPIYGFHLVDSELVFNGESRREMPAEGLFQGDGLHMTLAGHRLMAETYAEADGLGE